MSSRTCVPCQEHPFCAWHVGRVGWTNMSDPASIEHRHLRSAIEYAVVMGDEITKRKAPISVPREVRAVSGKTRIPTGSLGRLRRAIDSDEAFRTAISAGALPELVDPVGILWLQRPDGWEERIERLVAQMADDAADADLQTALRREEKRRRAAEQVAVRLRADVAERDSSIGALRGRPRWAPRRRRQGRRRGRRPACRSRRPAHRGPARTRS
jgi:hypothetical protein